MSDRLKDRFRAFLTRHPRAEALILPHKDEPAINRLSSFTYNVGLAFLETQDPNQSNPPFQIENVALTWYDGSEIVQHRTLRSVHSDRDVTIAVLESKTTRFTHQYLRWLPLGTDPTQRMAIFEEGSEEVMVLEPPTQGEIAANPPIIVSPRQAYRITDILLDRRPSKEIPFGIGKTGIMDFVSRFACLNEAEHYKKIVSGIPQEQFATTAFDPVR